MCVDVWGDGSGLRVRHTALLMIHSYGQPEVDKGLKWSKSAAQTFGELLSFRKDPFRLKTALNGNLECDLTVLPCFKWGGGG